MLHKLALFDKDCFVNSVFSWNDNIIVNELSKMLSVISLLVTKVCHHHLDVPPLQSYDTQGI